VNLWTSFADGFAAVGRPAFVSCQACLGAGHPAHRSQKTRLNYSAFSAKLQAWGR